VRDDRASLQREIDRRCVNEVSCTEVLELVHQKEQSCPSKERDCSSLISLATDVESRRQKFAEQREAAELTKQQEGDQLDAQRRLRELQEREAQASKAELGREEERAQREKEEAEADHVAKEPAHASKVEYYRLLGEPGRKQKLTDCYGSGVGLYTDCAPLADLLSEAAESEPEKRALVTLNERMIRRATIPAAAPAPAPAKASGPRQLGSGSGDSILCCDGSLSPSCFCSGNHRGCCSHHQGICGCQ
jgi:hypothetical protein